MPDGAAPDGEGPANAPGIDALLCDVMLGKLAVYLRACGYDAAYAGDRGVEADDRLLALADDEDRLLVTRDRQLAERTDEGVLLTAREVADQLSELDEAGFALSMADPPVRCGGCNGRLSAVDPGESTPGYAPDPATVECWRCGECEQVFWRGSHWDRMRRAIE